MSFKFSFPKNWDPELLKNLKEEITKAMNTGPRPSEVVEPFRVVDLSLGNIPPYLKLEKIDELSEKVTTLVFSFGYSGDALITVRTRVEVNKSMIENKSRHSLSRSLLGQTFLEMPLELSIQELKLEGQIKISIYNLPPIESDAEKKQMEVEVLLLKDPLKGLLVKTNFEREIPWIKSLFQKLVQNKAEEFITKAMTDPIKFKV